MHSKMYLSDIKYLAKKCIYPTIKFTSFPDAQKKLIYVTSVSKF